jgi:predicted thioredoxin/glutaredoxin
MLLTSYGCTPCLRIKRILNELQTEMPNLCIEEVEFKSLTGSTLSIKNSVLYPPAVFLDGKLLAKGKIDTEKMITAIRERREHL